MTPYKPMNDREAAFLKMANDPAIRESLLKHLNDLGLLHAFLVAENGG